MIVEHMPCVLMTALSPSVGWHLLAPRAFLTLNSSGIQEKPQPVSNLLHAVKE